MEPEKELFTWTAPSRPHQPLDKQLLAVALVIAILISIVFILSGEWMSVIVIASLIFAYYVWSTYPPENTNYAITTWGIRAHGHLHRWDTLTTWWLQPQGKQQLLVFAAPFERFRRLFLVLATDTTLDQLHSILDPYLTFEQPEPTLLDRATSWLARTFPLTQ